MDHETHAGLPVIAFRDGAELHEWLAAHHDLSPGIWVKIAKAGSGVSSVTFGEVLEEGLCFGWSENTRHPEDDTHYLQRFTPRASRGTASERNRRLVATLAEQGRMRPEGYRALGMLVGSNAADVHRIAAGMPGAVRLDEPSGAVVYQVSRKSFVFFRNPRPDALDSETGERLSDVIVIWVPSVLEKDALVGDPDTPFFTTPHFDGHLSVLVRAAHLPRVEVDELRELIEDAWLSRAPVTKARAWRLDHDRGG